jgi:hypothetical protein
MLKAIDDYALSHGLMASQLRFGTFLTDHFADEIVALRRARERAAEDALHAHDMLVTEVEPVTLPSEPPVTRPSTPPDAPASTRRRASDREPAIQAPQPQPSRRGLLIVIAVLLALLGAAAVRLFG